MASGNSRLLHPIGMHRGNERGLGKEPMRDGRVYCPSRYKRIELDRKRRRR